MHLVRGLIAKPTPVNGVETNGMCVGKYHEPDNVAFKQEKDCVVRVRGIVVTEQSREETLEIQRFSHGSETG
jgi:hypothetical protein